MKRRHKVGWTDHCQLSMIHYQLKTCSACLAVMLLLLCLFSSPALAAGNYYGSVVCEAAEAVLADLREKWETAAGQLEAAT